MDRGRNIVNGQEDMMVVCVPVDSEEDFSQGEVQELMSKFDNYFPHLSYILECGKPIESHERSHLKEMFRNFFPRLSQYLP